ncbi:DUF1206 domain-containing protein [Nocardioides stalactiti]|uniref:DUF1206 domain-containing protein n=1 Tax=Nocardioides stalactiti TaxID=2755356 RepID=UPI0016027AF9|nr:DUF1206 domain-containing protein [Nocardioides stalactiti]
MSVKEQAREAQGSTALSWVARLGYATYGVVYVVVGILAIQLALGDSTGKVSGQGALHELAAQPFGTAALVVAAIGLAALVLWEVCEAIGGHTDHDGARRWASRAGSAGRAVIFAVLAVGAAKIVLGSSSGGSGTDGWTARLMQLPLGPALVVCVGLAIAGYGLWNVVKGLTDRWRKQLEHQASSGDLGTAVTVLARTGFTGRGAAFVLVGALFVWAGVTHDAQKSAGLDQALHRLRDAPLGPWLLVAIAVGLGAYGVFNVAKAWFLKQR